MNDNKIAMFIEKHGGKIIGILIGLIVLSFNVLYEFFKFVLIIVVCAWAGNYVHKNKAKVKDFLRKLIDKM